MTTLASAISKAVTTSLLNQLPSALSGKFGVEQDAARAFLEAFLTEQLGRTKSNVVRAGVKGTNGKGRLSSFIVYSEANREAVKAANPQLKLTEVGKVLGAQWRDLPADQKAEWSVKAAKINEENGIATPAPSAAKVVVAKVAEKIAEAPSKGSAKVAAKSVKAVAPAQSGKVRAK